VSGKRGQIMTVRAASVLSAVSVMLSVCGQARAAFNELAVAAQAGTLGLGGDLTTNLIPQVNLRAGVQWLDFGFSAPLGHIDYDVDLNLLNPLVLIDWYPFSGSFRVSGGVLFNGSDIHLRAKPGEAVEIDGATYTPAELGSLRGDVEWRSMAPYVGIGWGNALGEGGRWGFATDLGVAFTGSPSIDLSATGPISTDPTFRTRLAEEERDIQDELDAFKFYPVLSISLFFRF
jgi:hypothetical protein